MSGLTAGGLTVDTDDRGRVHVWGEVRNLGRYTQRWAMVFVRLLGERGRVLAEQTDVAGLEWTIDKHSELGFATNWTMDGDHLGENWGASLSYVFRFEAPAIGKH
jgi:hypothetical protein